MWRRLRGVGRWGPSILLGLMIGAGPLWLWRAPLRWYFLKFDDFVYLARSRTPDALRHNLFRPHQGHVVPLFRLETYALARFAGSLEATPAVLAAASYVTLLLAMAMTGLVVGRETGRAALGLVAMAAVGLSSVPGPTLLWYASGQAMAAGTMVLAMLAALQSWRIGGAWWRLATAILAAMAAPLLWSGGFAAGPVGAAYLWPDGRRHLRSAAAAVVAASILMAGLAWIVGGRPPGNGLPTIGAVVAHSSQAVCEALLLNNLGLDAPTTEGQAMILGALIAGLWWRSRRTGLRINPLEAAGASMAIGTLGMIFAARGVGEDFAELRPLGWYHAMADLGAVLFACGWYAGRIESPPPATMSAPGPRELLGASVFAAAMLALNAPRADRVVFEYAEMAAPMARPVPGPVPPPDPSGLADQTRAQRAALARLDRLEASTRRGPIDRAAVRRAAADVAAMPAHLPGFDPAELIAIPDDRRRPSDPGGDRR